MTGTRGDSAQTFADLSRLLQAEDTAQRTMQKIVDLAPEIVEGCVHAAISTVVGRRIDTPASSGPVPVEVDRLQYETDDGPGLDAIRHNTFVTSDDLAAESRWPLFSSRAATETGMRSMLTFRLFVEQDTIGTLNLYSPAPRAFDTDGLANGAAFAAHAAVALIAAREHDHARQLQLQLTASENNQRGYAQQVQVAVALQRSMLTPLPDLGDVELAARYLPAEAAAEVGGDWYDAFALPDGPTALVVGDAAGHDIDAAVRMGQLRNLLRALAVDRGEPPGDLLRRLDRVATHLAVTIGTCIYALLEQPVAAPARLRFANAGHPPPLLVTADGAARYLETADHPLLGLGLDLERSSTAVDLPAGSTLLLYSDGLVEHRGRDIDDGLDDLRDLAAGLATRPVAELCDTVIARLAPHPRDDVCLLALRTPGRPI